jgi:hypothetical protein
MFVHKHTSLVSRLGHTNPIHTLSYYFVEIHFKFNVLLTVHHSNVINTSNLIHTSLSLSLSLSLLFGFKASTCFGNHLPIFRRHYTNADLASVMCPHLSPHTTHTKTAFV